VKIFGAEIWRLTNKNKQPFPLNDIAAFTAQYLLTFLPVS
jgi:hypothetical protein